MKKNLGILYVFFRVGLFTFGGGYAVIPVVERELIKKRAWVTMDEVMDFYTVSQIMPGMIGVNLSLFIGNKQNGAFAGFLAALGFVLPGVTILILAAIFISNLADVPMVQHAFAGIRIAVAALILDTVIKLVKGVFKQWKTLVIYIFVFALSLLPAGLLPAFMGSPAFLVLSSGLAGLLIFRQRKPKPNSESGP
jgi:chromate transporter